MNNTISYPTETHSRLEATQTISHSSGRGACMNTKFRPPAVPRLNKWQEDMTNISDEDRQYR